MEAVLQIMQEERLVLSERRGMCFGLENENEKS